MKLCILSHIIFTFYTSALFSPSKKYFFGKFCTHLRILSPYDSIEPISTSMLPIPKKIVKEPYH